MDTIKLPSYPGYSISEVGEVYGPGGRRLVVDRSGRVRIRVGKNVRLEYIATLLSDADMLRCKQFRRVAEDAQHQKLEAERRLALARRVNAHCLSLIRRAHPDQDCKALALPSTL